MTLLTRHFHGMAAIERPLAAAKAVREPGSTGVTKFGNFRSFVRTCEEHHPSALNATLSSPHCSSQLALRCGIRWRSLLLNKEDRMRAIFALALLPLMACEQEFNVGLSSVALIEPPDSPLSVTYDCAEGPAISVIFYEKDGTATVAMLGIGQQVLFQEAAASGFHYRNDKFELRGKGRDANWNQFGVLATDCTAIGDRI